MSAEEKSESEDECFVYRGTCVTLATCRFIGCYMVDAP